MPPGKPQNYKRKPRRRGVGPQGQGLTPYFSPRKANPFAGEHRGLRKMTAMDNLANKKRRSR